jgi:hypothetical protein
MAMNERPRPRIHRVATILFLATLACASAFGQEGTPAPRALHTAARFSAGAGVLDLQTAVAIAEPHAYFKNFSWVRVYFFAFDLTPSDIQGLSAGSIDGLERKRMQMARGGPDLNHSRAALHFLLDRDTLSNASLEVPGLTCTILVEPSSAPNAVQTFQFDGRQLQVKAKGMTVCDLTSIGGGKHPMTWDVDVDVPVFAKR